MCYPVCGMVHIKEPLLLFGMSNPCGGSGFPLLDFISCPPLKRRWQNLLNQCSPMSNVLSVVFNG